MEKKQPTSIRLSATDKALLKELADAHNVSMAAMLTILIRDRAKQLKREKKG
jgi:hypothetical protein